MLKIKSKFQSIYEKNYLHLRCDKGIQMKMISSFYLVDFVLTYLPF